MKILFLGEGELSGPARYLAAILRWSGLPFDHQPDETPIPHAWLKRRYDAVILSDYRADAWTKASTRWLVEAVHAGTGLMMIGGWASFTGLVGKYRGTDIEKLLPVQCLPGDDRLNRPAVLMGRGIRPVVVCGYHKVRPKVGTQTILNFNALNFSQQGPTLGSAYPALVLGKAGAGRTAAFMTDCAPHWAGGLVDWGNKRIRISLGPNNTVEVGETYLRFFRRLINRVSGHALRVTS